MSFSRRKFCVALSAAAVNPALHAEQKSTLASGIYDIRALAEKRIKTVVSHAMFAGSLVEGCDISLHQSDLDPHTSPHPPHSHRHEEMVLVYEGALEFTINGEATLAEAGSVLFAGSNELHGIRNPTGERSRYFVLALGPSDN